MSLDKMQEVFRKLSKGLLPEEFVEVCKEYPSYFVNYFEVVIDEDGTTYFAMPSHEQMVKKIAKEIYKADFRSKEYKTADFYYLISKFNLCSTHYNQIDAGRQLTLDQKQALRVYMNAGLIDRNATIMYTSDYQKYEVMRSFTEHDSDQFKSDALATFYAAKNAKFKEDLYTCLENDGECIPEHVMYIARKNNVHPVQSPLYKSFIPCMRYESFDKRYNPRIIEYTEDYFVIEQDEYQVLDRYEPGSLYSMEFGDFYKIVRGQTQFWRSDYSLYKIVD